MKLFLKVFVLIIGVVVAIGGVLVFVNTQVEAAPEVQPVDPWHTAAKDKAQQFDSLAPGMSLKDLNKSFGVDLHYLSTMNVEGFLPNAPAAEAQHVMATAFAPRYVECVKKDFKSPWTEAALYATIAHVNMLCDVKDAAGVNLFESKSFAVIKKIYDDYNNALKLPNTVVFSSSRNISSDVKAAISKATEYKNDSYLKNNAALVAKLNNLPATLEQKHYNYASNAVAGLEAKAKKGSAALKDATRVRGIVNTYAGIKDYGDHSAKAGKLYGRISAVENRIREYSSRRM